MKLAKWMSRSVSGSGRRFNRLWTIPCVVIIASLSVLAVRSFINYADLRSQARLVLAEIATQVSAIRLAEEIAEQDPQNASGSLLTSQLTRALTGLSRLDPDGEAADNVREAATEYLRNADEDFHLIRSRDPRVAEWQRLRSDPSYRLAIEAVNEARHFYTAESSAALVHAKLGSSAAIAAQALLIGLLILASQRIKWASELRFAEERVRCEVFFRSLVQNSSDVIVLVDASATTRYLSPSIERVLGHRPEDRLAFECFTNIHSEDQERAHLAFSRALDNPDAIIVEELRIRHADGSWRWIELSSKNLLADSNVGGIVINFRDISDRRLLEQQLRHQALTDPLTKLANRTLFQNLLDRALVAAKRRQTPVAVFFLDLDDFKQINDGLGHEAGDRLLCEIATRLRSTLRAEDTAARLGGDEFAVLLEGLDGEQLSELAERLLAAMRTPVLLGDQEVTVSMSIGVAITGAREYTSGELLRDADVALYAAKGAGKGRFEVFEDGMYKRVRKNLEVPETVLLQTLAEGIEASRQATVLDDMGCELGQGFILGRPVVGAAFESFLASAKGGACHLPQTLELAAKQAVGAAR
jgi:diguanylate cyclase (GGDEF)-like protein/PAS domain S-box-containing protein